MQIPISKSTVSNKQQQRQKKLKINSFILSLKKTERDPPTHTHNKAEGLHSVLCTPTWARRSSPCPCACAWPAGRHGRWRRRWRRLTEGSALCASASATSPRSLTPPPRQTPPSATGTAGVEKSCQNLLLTIQHFYWQCICKPSWHSHPTHDFKHGGIHIADHCYSLFAA